MYVFVIWAWIFVTGTTLCNAANILAMNPLMSKSHNSFYRPLLQELARKGHQIVYFTMAKNYPEEPGIYEIVTNITAKPFADMVSDVFESDIESEGIFSYVEYFDLFEEFCPELIYTEAYKELNNWKNKFDLILVEGAFNECLLGLVHKFNAPHIIVTPFGLLPWINTAVGNPNFYSYVPDQMFSYHHPFTFMERLSNLATGVVSSFYREYILLPRLHRILKAVHGPELPPLMEIERNASLVLANEHFFTHTLRPNVPTVIDAGGLYCRPSKPLPKDLEEYVSGSGDPGFIYFSMGSAVLGSLMPERQLEAFQKAFAKLPQRILWKWELDTMKNKPSNVKIGKWLPQQDILGHPKLRLYIAHGGLHSTHELAYHGVPALVFPVLDDQERNANSIVRAGIGIKLEFNKITEEKVLEALNEILTNSSYKEKASEVSRLMQDLPQTPLNRALFWTEYVMRHKGARHLRSAAVDLSWYQLMLLDVIAVILLSVLLVAVICVACIKCTYKSLCASKSEKLKTK